MRNMMVTTGSEDYVLMAEAKGLTPRRIMVTYAARNAILPSLASFAMSLGFVVSGAILIEIVFSYPGLGYVLFQAVTNNDYPLMQGVFLIITRGCAGGEFHCRPRVRGPGSPDQACALMAVQASQASTGADYGGP